MVHWNCLEREALMKTGSGTLAGTNCPICQAPLLPSNEGINSPIIIQLRKQLAGTKWADQLPLSTYSPPSSSRMNKNGIPLEDHQAHTLLPNELQPNGRRNEGGSGVVAIDIGIRPTIPPATTGNTGKDVMLGGRNFNTITGGRRPTIPTTIPLPGAQPSAITIALNSAWRLLVNFVTLRNLRACGFGASPRRLLLLVLIVAVIIVFSVHFIIPWIISSNHAI